MRYILLCLIYAIGISFAYEDFAPARFGDSSYYFLLMLGVLGINIITWYDKPSKSLGAIAVAIWKIFLLLMPVIGLALVIYGIIEFLTPEGSLTLGDNEVAETFPLNKLTGGAFVLVGLAFLLTAIRGYIYVRVERK